MKALRLINIGILALLGCVAGGVKLVPQNVDLFMQAAGFNTTMIVAIGVVQLASGLFLLHAKTRFWAAVALGLTLIASSASLLMAGYPRFVGYSLVPVAMVGIVIWQSRPQAGAG